MPRHIADHDKTRGESRAREYTRIEREAEPNQSAKALHRRKADEDKGQRLKEYTRIERGREA